MCNRRKITILIIMIFMLLIAVSGNAADIDPTAAEITQDVNGVLFGFIEFLQWVITAVMLIITTIGILPELFSQGRPPDLAVMFMKFIQAAIIIGITWAVGDLIALIFGANINPAMIV